MNYEPFLVSTKSNNILNRKCVRSFLLGFFMNRVLNFHDCLILLVATYCSLENICVITFQDTKLSTTQALLGGVQIIYIFPAKYKTEGG